MTPEMFRTLLKSWRATIKPRYRSRTKAPTLMVRFPSAMERKYAKFLERLYKAYTAPLLAGAREYFAVRKVDHMDADSSQLDALFGDLENHDINIFYNYTDPELYRGQYNGVEANVRAIGWETMQGDLKQWQKALNFAIPAYMLENEPYMAEALDNWSKLQATIIDADVAQFYAKAEGLIRNAVMTGNRAESIVSDLMAMDAKLTRNRAKFIARNEIGNLQSSVNQKRNESLGLSMYTWRTAMDERVRGRPMGKWEYADTSHWLMEGKLCKWSDPTVYSADGGKTWQPRSDLKAVVTYHAMTKVGERGKPGKASGKGKSKVVSPPNLHPGIGFNCRCGSISFLGNLVAELDAELAEAGY